MSCREAADPAIGLPASAPWPYAPVVAVNIPGRLRDFVKLHQEVEAVLQHVGLRTWDLLLVDVEGNWTREEFPSEGLAEAACRELGIRLNRGWDDPRMARRMNRRDHWNRPGGQRRAL